MGKSWNTAALVAALLLLAPSTGQATTVVEVSFFDRGAAAGMSTGMRYGMAEMDMNKATMWMKLSSESVKAGDVTFKVTNNSHDMVHELIVVRLTNPTDPIPYDEKGRRVDEKKAGDLGEVADLDPGKSGTLTLHLEPGKYLLICNQPGHFDAGMWKEFTVME